MVPDPSPVEQPVQLVSERGVPVGIAGKMQAHQPPGMLHLAFSVALFDDNGRMLLQKRSGSKQHFRGRWSNACCSHPHPGADIVEEAQRRLGYELGVSCQLSVVGSFAYRSIDSESGLVEYEFDTVLLGQIDQSVQFDPSPEEVSDLRFVDVDWLQGDIVGGSLRYTPWLQQVLGLALAAREG